MPLTAPTQIHASDIGTVDTEQKYPFGTLAFGTVYVSSAGTAYAAPSASGATRYDGNIYIYLKGVASTIVGSAVTYDEAGVTTLIVANGKGPVAFATGVTDATTEYGWYLVAGTGLADIVANSADNSTIGRETTDGKVGDGRAAGDQIANCFQRVATTAAAVGIVQCYFPFVDDFQGA